MLIHHLNCGTMCPMGGWLMDGCSAGLVATLVCHCLLIETEGSGLVLVDTGFGSCDIADPETRLSGFYRALLRPRLRPAETAAQQVRGLGYSPRDVRHILLTHLDFDHAGGLDDFPEARIHLLANEAEAASHRDRPVARGRYRPSQWSSRPRWQLYPSGGESWFGFAAVRPASGLPPELLLIPLPGHTKGHCGIAVHNQGRWLLHAGDAYFYREECLTGRCTPGLSAYQRLMEVDRLARLTNQARLRELAIRHPAEVTVTCAHDRRELAAFSPAMP